MAVFVVQPEEEARLQFVLRTEIGVAALGGHDFPSRAGPEEHRLAEACAGAEDGDRRGRGRRAGVERDHVGVGEERDAEGDRVEVVDQSDARDRKGALQRRALHQPLQVRDLGAVLDHRPGDGEASRVDLRAGGDEELAQEVVERDVAAAGKALFRDDRLRRPVDLDELQQRLRPADVPRDDAHASANIADVPPCVRSRLNLCCPRFPEKNWRLQ